MLEYHLVTAHFKWQSSQSLIQAPSTRIRIHSSTQDSSWNIGNRACIVKTSKSRVKSKRKTWEPGCHLKYSIHGKELGWILLRHRKKNIYPDLKLTRFRVHSVFKNSQSGERNSSTLELPVSKSACN